MLHPQRFAIAPSPGSNADKISFFLYIRPLEKSKKPPFLRGVGGIHHPGMKARIV